jgi:hypothetical protein
MPFHKILLHAGKSAGLLDKAHWANSNNNGFGDFLIWGRDVLKKITILSLAMSLTAASVLPASAGPSPVVTPVTPAGSSTGFGAWVAGGIIGVAAFLGIYDVTRRTTCSGDVLHLGGPGFTQPIGVSNVMIPQCPVTRTKRRH